MHANLEYEIPSNYTDFVSRLLIFVKKNFLLYIPDVLLLFILILPPYELKEFLMIITALVILGFRDIVVIRRSMYYLKSVKIDDAMVELTILRYSQIIEKKQSNINNIIISLEDDKKPFKLDIYENQQLIHRQYAIGYWSIDKLRELEQRFNSLKSEMDLGIMFKGASLN